MTTEEAIARIREHKIIHKMNEPRAIYISEALDLAIKALEQEPCEDCISRQEAIKAIQDEYYDHAVGINIVDIIAHMPPVIPKAGSEEDNERAYVDVKITDNDGNEFYALLDRSRMMIWRGWISMEFTKKALGWKVEAQTDKEKNE